MRAAPLSARGSERTGDRTRGDLCPGLSRPWIADDGALVRLRLVGGRLPRPALAALLDVAETYGDGAVHLTRRANLQLRALPHGDGVVPPEVATAVRASGLVPSASHELVRNYLASVGSPATRADLRGPGALLHDLDTAVRASPALAGLSARFLFVLDDGSGDVVERPCDLGLVALTADEAQLRVGSDWGPVVPLTDAVAALVELAEAFVVARGTGPSAPWHVDELDTPLAPAHPVDPRLPTVTEPPAYGVLADGRAHLEVPDARLTRALDLPGDGDVLVTPWRSLVVGGVLTGVAA